MFHNKTCHFIIHRASPWYITQWFSPLCLQRIYNTLYLVPISPPRWYATPVTHCCVPWPRVEVTPASATELLCRLRKAPPLFAAHSPPPQKSLGRHSLSQGAPQTQHQCSWRHKHSRDSSTSLTHLGQPWSSHTAHAPAPSHVSPQSMAQLTPPSCSRCIKSSELKPYRAVLNSGCNCSHLWAIPSQSDREQGWLPDPPVAAITHTKSCVLILFIKSTLFIKCGGSSKAHVSGFYSALLGRPVTDPPP